MFEYIILAYNDTEIRSILYEVLTDYGYKVAIALTYREIIDMLKKERPDYIIIDPAVISDLSADTVLNKIKLIDNNIKVLILDCNKGRFQIIQDILKILKEEETLQLPQGESKALQVKANVLIVDDELECAELIKNYLSKKGYIVDTALSAEEAILKIKTNQTDVVLLDIRLSGMDGIIALKAIKDIDKSIIVIMTTAMEDDAIVKEAIKLGADGYLVKPFNISKLEMTILINILHRRFK